MISNVLRSFRRVPLVLGFVVTVTCIGNASAVDSTNSLLQRCASVHAIITTAKDKSLNAKQEQYQNAAKALNHIIDDAIKNNDTKSFEECKALVLELGTLLVSVNDDVLPLMLATAEAMGKAGMSQSEVGAYLEQVFRRLADKGFVTIKPNAKRKIRA